MTISHISDFLDAGADENEPVKGITQGDIRCWFDQMEYFKAQKEIELKRLWHFAGCPYDHCMTCIADAAWIRSLETRLGPPSAESVQAQHDAR